MARIRPPRFDEDWQRSRRRSRQRGARWRGARTFLKWGVPLIVMLGGWAVWDHFTRQDQTETVWLEFRPCDADGKGPCAIDGDTLAIGRERIRLTGFDAPERDGACPREGQLAREATQALVGWLNAGPFTWDGGREPPRDRYGRALRAVWREEDGRRETLADHMIAAGLAGETGWGAEAIDWCSG